LDAVPRLSFIMVSYYTGPVLREAIDAVLGQDSAIELILVNNGNPPETACTLRELASDDPRVTLVSRPGNVGFAAACNAGCLKATGDVIVILNPDCVVDAHCATQVLDIAASLPSRWLLGIDIRNRDGSPQRGARRNLPTPWIAFIELAGIYKLAPRHPYFKRINNHDTALPGTEVPVPAVSGAFMAMRRHDYWSIGGMDDHYFLHVEDIDMLLRWQKSGGQTFFTPQIQAMHAMSTSRTNWRFIEWHKTRGLCRYFRTHFESYYPPGFISILQAGLYAKYFLSMIGRALSSTFAPAAREKR